MTTQERVREIAVIQGITWSIHYNGRLQGKDERGFTRHEFWTGNPPSGPDLKIFIAVCDLAVSLGLLRKIPVYMPM